MRGGQKGKHYPWHWFYSRVLLRIVIRRKHFDKPHLNVIGKNFVICRHYPALWGQGHHINPVPVKHYWDRWFHCVDCKLMGRLETFEQYSCKPQNKINYQEMCGCNQCKKYGPCTWAQVSMICHGID